MSSFTLRYMAGRIVWLLVVLWAVTTITFVLIFVIPSDPVRAIVGGHAPASVVATIRHQYGFDAPVLVQYGRFWGRLVQGNLGFSFATHQEVASAVIGRLGATAELALAGVLLELVIGIPVGALAAWYRGTWRDRTAIGIAVVGLATPPFWLGIMLIWALAFKVPLFPIGGIGGLSHLVLPALTIGITGGAYYARLLRARMIEVADEEFVRASRARGMAERSIFFRHVLRNSLVPVITWLGMDLGYFLSGVVVVEVVFGWPGIGMLAYQAISQFDTPMIVGTVLVSAVAIAVLNLIVDLAYPLLDPRIARD
jgi:ABC-type dipeptide/oligopeptide/nickel transport system permease component